MKKFLLLFICAFLLLITNINVYSQNIWSQSGILMDMDTKQVIYQRNMHTRFLTASIAKIMTCLIAIEEKPLNLVVTITREDILAEGSAIYLPEGEEVYLKDLLYGLMLRSGNDAAHAIAIAVAGSVEEFAVLMNRKAEEIGMKNSRFANPSGLDSETQNFSTSFDMALLMSYAMDNPLFREINNTKTHSFTTLGTETKHTFQNKHRLINQQSIYNGGKTGFTRAAGRTLVTTATYENVNLVVVTFKGSTGDFKEHQALFQAGFRRYSKQVFMRHGIIRVREDGEVRLKEITEDVYIMVNTINNSVITSRFERIGDNVYLVILADGERIRQVELLDYCIEQSDNQHFWRFIRRLFT